MVWLCCIHVLHSIALQQWFVEEDPPSQPEFVNHQPDLCNRTMCCVHMTMNYDSRRSVAPLLSWHLSGMVQRHHRKLKGNRLLVVMHHIYSGTITNEESDL